VQSDLRTSRLETETERTTAEQTRQRVTYSALLGDFKATTGTEPTRDEVQQFAATLVDDVVRTKLAAKYSAIFDRVKKYMAECPASDLKWKMTAAPGN